MEAGIYTYTLDTDGACPTYTATVEVVIVPTPEAPVISGNTSFCAGLNTSLTSNVNANIVWSTGQTTPTINLNTAGTYTVTRTVNGCTATS
ncbi:MAG TPA: hypothetical protein PL070_18365, partial [Flavobacteriales bacterium]|nr:hypothetical protein [Flavobacteriales bacterium]